MQSFRHVDMFTNSLDRMQELGIWSRSQLTYCSSVLRAQYNFAMLIAAVTQILSYLRTRIKYFEEYRFSVDQDLMLVAVFCTNED